MVKQNHKRAKGPKWDKDDAGRPMFRSKLFGKLTPRDPRTQRRVWKQNKPDFDWEGWQGSMCGYNNRMTASDTARMTSE